MTAPLHQLARERVEADRLRNVGDDDLVRVVLGADVTLAAPISTLAWASAHEIATVLRISRSKAARLAAVFELGRRGAWNRPMPGQRCLDPASVFELMRDVAAEQVEEFHVVLLDVRGRLLGRGLISRGGLAQCPVSPRDGLPSCRRGRGTWSRVRPQSSKRRPDAESGRPGPYGATPRSSGARRRRRSRSRRHCHGWVLLVGRGWAVAAVSEPTLRLGLT
jgi:RadC-like JAB domain-containing protein